jgi:hypothetical protein
MPLVTIKCALCSAYALAEMYTMSNIILQACREPELLHGMGERARVRIQQLWLSWEKQLEAMKKPIKE